MDKEKERLRDEEETNDIITAEDLAEQALYAATAPDCCSDAEKAKHMLGMLGANVSDEEVYHAESEHIRQAVIDRVAEEFDAFPYGNDFAFFRSGVLCRTRNFGQIRIERYDMRARRIERRRVRRAL